MEDKQEQSGLGMIAPAIGPAVAGIYSIFGPSRDQLRREQLEDQQKYTDMQAGANRDQARFTSDLQYEMWNKTNYEAQMKHMKEAGLNPALLYGKGGAGGATTGSASAGSVSGGSAPEGAAIENAKTARTAAALQISSQLALQKAQKENIEADTENKKAQTGKTGVETEIGKIDAYTKEQTKNEVMDTIIANASKAISEAGMATIKKEIDTKTSEDQIKTIQQEAIRKILDNTGIEIENRIKKAEQAIQEFEAESAKKGISTKAPWYIKMMGKMYDEIEKLIK